jgi:hypothetical protein
VSAAAFVAGPGCGVDLAAVTLAGAGERVTAALRLEITSDGGCRSIAFPLPAGAVPAEVGAVERRADGTRIRLDATRWSVSARDADGGATLTLAVPDLWARDRVVVTLERAEVPAAVASAWSEGRAAPAGPAVAAAQITRRSQVLTLQVPPGDPQLHLHPGGAASSHVDEEVVVAPAEVEQAFVPALPPGAAPALRVEPAGAAALVPLGGVWQVRVAPSEAPARLLLSWDDPACPTHGERGALDALTVRADQGRFAWDGDRWALVGVRDEVVLPDRDALIRALDRRFKSAALPEPGLPPELRGAPTDRSTLEALRPLLAARAPTLPPDRADPLFVRPLQQARKSGALTPSEAAAITWLYARQLRFDAHWAFVRPAPSETLPADAPEPLSPAGYVAPLVVVALPDGEVWLDPACGACGPFELRPELEGARALSPSGRVRTPAPTPGALRVEVEADTVTLEASGPPALRLREALAGVPVADRAAALAARVGGPGAALREVTGIDTGGAPVRVVTTRGDGPVPDPTAPPAPGPDGTVWWDWVGPRAFVVDGVETRVDVPARRAAAPVSPPPPDPAPPSPTSETSSP